MKNILIVSKNEYFKKKLKKYKNFKFLTEKNYTIKKVQKFKPFCIMFPHWGKIVSEQLLKKYICIGFHATPLPYGRGGSPIQNMIVRGRKKTTVCAYKMTNKFDEGPIFLKKNMKLDGSANEIFLRLYSIIEIFIVRLSKKLPSPKKQKGLVVNFKRRKKQDSKINFSNDIVKLYNFIRMLDLNFKGFPKAFLEQNKYKLVFENAKLLNKKMIKCELKILKKN